MNDILIQIYDIAAIYWPHSAAALGTLAAILTGLRWVSKRTENKIDDKIVDVADKTGITAFLKRFNPFKK